MDANFLPTAFEDIREAVRQHLATLPSAIDSFLEDHILASAHFRIVVSGETAGFASIHEEKLITQFALTDPYKRHGQRIFAQLRRREQVQSAFVPTCDEFFLAHALDDYRQLTKQAYFFATARDAPPPTIPNGFSFRVAKPSDIEFIRQQSGDFFEPVERYVEKNELSVTLRGNEIVGFGILDRSTLYTDVASIGMYTIETFRQDGVGTATIALMIEECRRQGLRAVAGCWYYNHRSKRTLERAGMFSPTRLLRVEY
jgi:RimJ/RimL family protein N-acetyltransferase